MLGRRLRELREKAGISHAEMVETLYEVGWEIDPAVLTRIEKAQRQLSDREVHIMLKALKLPWSVFDEGETNPLRPGDPF